MARRLGGRYSVGITPYAKFAPSWFMKDPNLFPPREINLPDLTRRNFLQGLGCLAAAAALPLSTARASEESAPGPAPTSDPTVINKLTAYMSEAANREISAEAAEKAKHHILDTMAAMVSGADLPPAVVAFKFARLHAGDKEATVVGSELLCGAMDAALVNGMLAHSDETDDSHAPAHIHPGCSIVPAALASGEHYGASG